LAARSAMPVLTVIVAGIFDEAWLVEIEAVAAA
jgi:enamine deaminase RidA (YjgF/YER057c/UK114 family)